MADPNDPNDPLNPMPLPFNTAMAIARLEKRKAQIALELSNMSMSNPGTGGVPTSSIGGQSVSWVEHRRALLEEIKGINEAIVALQPFELRTIAF